MAAAAVVGLGTIGSHLIQHLARMADITRLILIDRDTYEEKNLRTQFITVNDLGRPKAEAQAERLSAASVNSGLSIHAICEDFRNVPWGSLNCDVLLSCCDNRLARLFVAETAWRRGIPLVDSGVRKEGMLIRVDVYDPMQDRAPCYECSLTQQDYDQLELQHPCDNDKERHPSATDSPSFLGSLSASVQAAECAKLLTGDRSSAGSRIVLSANSYMSFVSSLMRNDQCRFDHRIWNLDNLKESCNELSVLQVLDHESASREDLISHRSGLNSGTMIREGAADE